MSDNYNQDNIDISQSNKTPFKFKKDKKKSELLTSAEDYNAYTQFYLEVIDLAIATWGFSEIIRIGLRLLTNMLPNLERIGKLRSLGKYKYLFRKIDLRKIQDFSELIISGIITVVWGVVIGFIFLILATINYCSEDLSVSKIVDCIKGYSSIIFK